MPLTYHAFTVVSVAVFLYFGLTCLFANGMAEDFERFGLAHLRMLTGTLEVLGAVGLVVGIWIPALRLLSAAGLALLMLMGLIARLRQRDSLREMLPAGVLMVVNAFIAWNASGVRTPLTE